MTASKLTGILEKNRAAGILSRIPYIPAAFPEAEGYWNVVKELADNGADIIEIGVPFSDPIADGPVVAGASQKALANGGTLNFIFDGLEKYRAEINSGLVLMGYVNPFLQYAWAEAADCTKCRPVQDTMAESLKRLAARLAKSGVDGVIVPDLPLEESESWVYAFKMEGVDLIALVGPNTGLEKMKLYAQSGMSGYVYVVSVMGTTGVRQGLPPEVADTLKRARQAFDLPLALGFGLSSPSQVEAIEKEARPDAAVFGSALIKHLENGGKAADFMAPWN
ncbi:tryptophan synthase subunit alpha [Deltaproteobacteria bacterium OttesenSCG-928-K17]|nr:tryptophan synthase subunit alpha [Deltaproteobacteria bacterium OttesenSCG-928-K17]